MNKEDRKKITLREREFKGSRFRCLQLTHQPDKNDVREFLNSLVTPYATISGSHWAPKGFIDPKEARLGQKNGFVEEKKRLPLKRWWLKNLRGANTPNWDLVAEAHFGPHKDGLILVEAKAHEGEFDGIEDKTGAEGANLRRIREALSQASGKLDRYEKGFNLSAENHYQLSNRFAYSWKLATMGIPVVLVYLGFLDAEEMDDGSRTLLRSARQWEDCVKQKSKAHVPNEVWENTFDVNGTPLTFLIRSARVTVTSEVV